MLRYQVGDLLMVSQMRKKRAEEQARDEQADLRESVLKGELVNSMDVISHHKVGKEPMYLQHKRCLPSNTTSA